MNALRFSAGATAVLATGLAFAGRIDIVSEAQAPKWWQPDPAARQYVAGYPEAAADKARDVCVSVGYLIRTDGSTSDFIELKSWSSATPDGTPRQQDTAPYVQVAAAVVSRWRFVPTGKRHSIYTSATFAFDGADALDADAIRNRCSIADLPDFVAKAKSRTDSRGDLTRARSERARQENEAVEPMGTGL